MRVVLISRKENPYLGVISEGYNEGDESVTNGASVFVLVVLRDKAKSFPRGPFEVSPLYKENQRKVRKVI